MTSVLLSGPDVEPISLDEAKAHLRVELDAENVLIQSLIMASRLHIEAALNLALITQSWRLQFDAWPRGRSLVLPIRPVRSLLALAVVTSDGDRQLLDPNRAILDANAHAPRLILPDRAGLPLPGRAANGVEIDILAGYGDTPAAVPQAIRQALLLLVAHWYENREPVEISASASVIPTTISELLSPFRRRRL